MRRERERESEIRHTRKEVTNSTTRINKSSNCTVCVMLYKREREREREEKKLKESRERERR